MEDAEEHNLVSLIEEHDENFHPDLAVWSIWYAQFLEYSCRNFTNARDRLPAISPLAKVVADMTGDQYLAGLWKNNLHVGLLWYSNRFEGRTFCLPGHEDYIAPSWSWLARARNAEISQYVVTHSITSYLNVVDADTTPDGLNPFGRVLEGYIKLEGRVCAISSESFREAATGRDTTHKEIMLEDKFVAECSFDQDESADDDQSDHEISILEEMPETLYLLVVRDGLCLKAAMSRAGRDISEQNARSAMSGLILTPSSRTEGEFLRIGTFESPPIEPLKLTSLPVVGFTAQQSSLRRTSCQKSPESCQTLGEITVRSKLRWIPAGSCRVKHRLSQRCPFSPASPIPAIVFLSNSGE